MPPSRRSRQPALLLAAVASCATFLRVGLAAPVPIPPALVTLDSVSTESGTCNGGQRLQVFGSGFATNHHDAENLVEIGSDAEGWRECDVIQGACTVDCGSASKIVCDTKEFPQRSMWQKKLDVKVTVAKGSTPSVAIQTAKFTCTTPEDSAESPTVLGVAPRHVSANWAVNITGSRFGSNIKDYRVVYVGEGRPPSGGNVDTGEVVTHAICRPQSLNRGVKPGEEKQVHTQVVMQEDYSTLEIWEDFFRCELGDFSAGSYTVSVHVQHGLAWSNPVATGLYSRDARGTAYQLQYFPTIKTIWPPVGSVAGGTSVVITGGGFSMQDTQNEVFIGSVPCRCARPPARPPSCLPSGSCRVVSAAVLTCCTTSAG